MPKEVIQTQDGVDVGIPISDIPVDHWTETRLAEEVWGRFDGSYMESRKERTIEWVTNWRFTFGGDQWYWWNNEAQEFAPLPVPPERQHTENHLIGAVRHAAANLTPQNPAWDTAPKKRDFGAKRAARLGKQTLFHYHERLNLGQTAYQTAVSSLVVGMGIEKTYWNSDAGEVKFKYKANNEPPEVDDYTGEPFDEAEILRKQPRSYDEKPYRAGSMCIDRVSAWNFFPQAGLVEPSLRNAAYCIEASWHSPSALRRMFNLSDNFVFDEDFAPQYRFAAPGDQAATGSNIGLSTFSGAYRDGRVLVLTYYQLPAPVPGFEKGAVISVCGRKILGKPYRLQCWEKGGKYPFQLFPWQPRDNKFWPRPWVTDLIEPQMRINQALSHQLTWTGLLCGPNLLTTKGDGIPRDIPIGFVNLQRNLGTEAPAWLAPPQAPPELFNIKKDAEAGFDQVGRQFAAGYGKHQQGMPSGYYLRLLEEAGQIDKEPIVRYHADARREQGELLLRLAKNYETTDEIVNIVGTANRGMAIQFKADDLEPDLYSVSVQPTSIMRFMAANRAQQAMELYEKGFWGPPGQLPKRVERRLIEWMNLPDLFDIDDEYNAERGRAELNHDLIVFEGWTVDPPPQPAQPGQPPPEPPQPRQEGEARLVVDPRWEPAFFIEEARIRLLETDVDEWPAEVRQNFDNYFATLQAALQAQVDAQMAAEDAKIQKALDTEKQKAEGVEQAKAKGHIAEEAGKALLSTAAGATQDAPPTDKPPKQVNSNLVIKPRGESRVAPEGGREV